MDSHCDSHPASLNNPGFSFGKDMSSAVSYPSCTKSMPLMPSAKVSECTDQSHLMHDISVKLSLDTNGIGKGCDRESHSNVLSHHKCGMKHITDLLPSNGKDWLEHLVKEENTQGIYAFTILIYLFHFKRRVYDMLI